MPPVHLSRTRFRGPAERVVPVLKGAPPRTGQTGERHAGHSRLGRLFRSSDRSGTCRRHWFLAWFLPWRCPGRAVFIGDVQWPVGHVVSVIRPRQRHNHYDPPPAGRSAPAVTAATFSTLIGLARSARDAADVPAVPADPAVFVSGIDGMLPESPLLLARRSSIRCGLDNSRSESHAIPTCPEDRVRFAHDCSPDSSEGTVRSLAMERS